MFFSPNSRCYSTVDDFVKKTKQSLQQNQRSTLIIVRSKSKLVTCMCSRTPKSFSNGPILCARNKKNTFKDVDTRSVPDVDNWLFFFPQIVVFQYCQPFIQESWSYDAQVYTNVFCLLCCFSKLASAACICRFRKRLLRARYGMHGEKSLTGCMTKGQKSVSQNFLFPWCPTWNSNSATIAVEILIIWFPVTSLLGELWLH